jgi:hypothetical protein
MDAQELRLFLVCSPGPDAYIAAPTAGAAIDLFCKDLGEGDDENRSDLDVSELAGDMMLNLPDEPGKRDERTAAQWVEACNGVPTIIGHTEV